LLGDNTGGGAVMLRPIFFFSVSMLEFEFQLGSLLYTDIFDPIYTHFRFEPELPESNFCVS
jgi:hypothetical protein